MDPEAKAVIKIVSTVCVVIVVFIGAGMYGCPHYSVWQQNLAGQAELVRATQNRQIRIQEANARYESAKLDAQSEIERARGTSEANKIVANGLGGPEGYLRYLYILQLGNADKNERTVIYVPTEGLLPVTEAGRGLPKR